MGNRKTRSDCLRPPEHEFREFYENHSGRETAELFSISTALVCKYAREFNIPRRSFKYKELIPKPTSRQIEILNGSLLGDGCLEAVDTPKCNSRFIEKHGMQQLKYLQWKCNELKPFTTEVKLGTESTNDKLKDFCKMQTCKHPIFTELEKNWYDEHRIKHVPHELELTPLTLAIWFLDDGHNCKGENLTIYTNGFSLDEVKILVLKLKKLGIKNCHERQNQESRGSKPEIYVEKSSCAYFLDIIRSHVNVDCMKYKLKGPLL